MTELLVAMGLIAGSCCRSRERLLAGFADPLKGCPFRSANRPRSHVHGRSGCVFDWLCIFGGSISLY